MTADDFRTMVTTLLAECPNVETAVARCKGLRSELIAFCAAAPADVAFDLESVKVGIYFLDSLAESLAQLG